jgi:hypothetical protein
MISRSLPKVKQHANDRIPKVEEIKKLIEYPDRRIKPIVLLSVSTGMGLYEMETYHSNKE